MPDKWRWLLFGHEPAFWVAMFATSMARAALTSESPRSALVTVPASVVVSIALTKAILHLLNLPADPYGIAVGALVVLLCQPVLRLVVGLQGVKDVAEIIRAWRAR
jgi:hypothetical protein